ncbi:hypothetical protein HIM_08527 [Hirsutella minnesotensis 3608]|uniref:MULE transposase domain-containing protein n=1 Tax=Hirsutella minnesotensis 3608 TaxID=1043627 RepID=A0A0F7ZY93_9HYPO|nr:hypothetical protein HIM_08527 [Hirsutella minnesotensis 3608]
MDAIFSRQFESREAAKAACSAVAKQEGFALAIRNKKPPGSDNPTYLLLRCSKGGAYRDQRNETVHESKRRNNTHSLKSECPFQINIKLKHEGPWAVAPSRSSGPHNHPFTPAATHSKYLAELIAAHRDQIIHFYNCGLRPFLIASHLRGLSQDDPDLAGISSQHIRNALALYRAEELAGRTPIEFLYGQLKDSSLGFFFRDTRDQEGRLTGLFIAPRSGIELWRRFWSILLLDCTYKTNRFKMPLLNVCGSTSERKTFSVASIFLSGEAEPQYRWALQCLLELAAEEGIPMPRVIVTDRELALMNALISFPELRLVIHLLCRWHVNKNVLAQSKKHFPKATRDERNRVIRAPEFTAFLKEWHALINAPDEASYDQQLQAFMVHGHPQAAVDYAVKTWLEPWKEKIVLYCVDRYCHLGHTTTSIIEGMHSTMKRFLWTSTGDLTSVFRRFQNFWKHQSDEILNTQQKAIHKMSTSTLKPVFVKIRPNLSNHALKMIGGEFRAVAREVAINDQTKPPAGRCDLLHHCGFKSSLGLPCRHDIFNRLKSGAGTAIPFEMTDVDEFWHRETQGSLL